MALVSYAQAAQQALALELQQHDDVVLMGEDIGRGGVFGQYAGLQATYGVQRVMDTPISEAAIVGVAVGMALTGTRPVVELRVMDFALCAIDEIVNQAAKNRFMFGGQGRVPVVMRMPIGVWTGSAAQHSQSLESWFVHVPGLVVVAPATPLDNHVLLRAALRSGDPVVYLEHKELWASQQEVTGWPEQVSDAELGAAKVRREGSDITLVAWSRALTQCLEAADTLNAQGVSAEVIDLRTLWPWDKGRVMRSVEKTGRLLVVHEAVQVAGLGAEIVATLAAHATTRSKALHRMGAPRVPVAYSPALEPLARLHSQAIVKRVNEIIQSPPLV